MYGHGYARLLSRRDVAAERQRRGDGFDSLSPFADPAYRNVTVVEDAAENALIDVHALDLVQTHLESPAFDEAGLSTTRKLVTSVSVVQR